MVGAVDWEEGVDTFVAAETVEAKKKLLKIKIGKSLFGQIIVVF
jgi:hypothetical protein